MVQRKSKRITIEEQNRIVNGIQKEDRIAVRNFVEHFGDKILILCKIRMIDKSNAQELAHTVILDLITKIQMGKYDPNHHGRSVQLQTYVARMTDFAIRSYKTNQRDFRENHTTFDETNIDIVEEVSAESELSQADRQEVLNKILRSLTKKCREILTLKYLKQITYRDLAKQLQLTSEASARGRVRDCLEQAQRRARKSGLSPEEFLMLSLM